MGIPWWSWLIDAVCLIVGLVAGMLYGLRGRWQWK